MKENKKSKKRRIFQVFLLMICSAILYVSYAAYDIWSYRFKTDDDVKTDAGISARSSFMERKTISCI